MTFALRSPVSTATLAGFISTRAGPTCSARSTVATLQHVLLKPTSGGAGSRVPVITNSVNLTCIYVKMLVMLTLLPMFN